MKSSTFCIAPYVHCLVHSDKTLKPCCVSKAKSTYTFENYEKYWNSDENRQLRKELYNGVKSKECNYCWNIEKLGKLSLRQNYNSLFNKYINFTEIKNSPLNDFRFDSMPVTWDLRLGNLCNLKCIMCNPTYSDKIEKESEHNKLSLKLVDSNMITSALPGTELNWAENESAKQFLDSISKSAKWIKLQGGEPFLFKNMHEFLNSLNEDIVLSTVTNGTVLSEQILTCLSKLKKVELSISIEAANSDNNIIRYGSDWDKIDNNLQKFKSLSNIEIQINHVLQITSIKNLPDIINYAEYNNFHLLLSKLEYPECLSLKSCPTRFLEDLNKTVNAIEIKNPKNQYIKKFITTVVSNTVYSRHLNETLLKYANYLDNIRELKFKPLIQEYIEQ